MLATGFYLQHFHMPSRPSPLAERSANAAPRPFQFTMPTPAQTEKKSYTAPQRAYKPNPVVQTRDAATKRRRDMFFNRVQKERDDKKWEVRGEQVCGIRAAELGGANAWADSTSRSHERAEALGS